MTFELTFNTDNIVKESRIEFVRKIFAPLATVCPINTSNVYAHAQIRKVQSVILVNVTISAYEYVRSNELVWQSNLDMYMLTVALEGTHFHCSENDEIFNIMDGDIILIDLAKSCRGITNTGRHLQIYIPKDLLNNQLDSYKIRQNILLKANKPMTKILKDYMLGLFNVASKLEEKEASVTLYALLSLLATAVKGVKSNSLLELNENNKGNDILKKRVFDFIEINIKNSDLTIELLMKSFRVSRAHLYRAFDEDGGVISVIKNKRLDMAYHELLNPTNNCNVTQIAHEYGFSSSNQFYRVFRQRFGFSPNEIKRDQAKFNHYLNIKNDLYEHFKRIIQKK